MVGTSLALLCPPYSIAAHTFSNGTSISVRFASHAGTGSEIRQPLGYAMVGGLIVSQALTLFTTPVVYLYLDRLSNWFAGWGRSGDADHKAHAREGAVKQAAE